MTDAERGFPAGMVTDAGVATDVESSLSVTLAPTDGAGALILTVPVTVVVLPPVTGAGEMPSI